MERIEVLIADDHRMVAEGVSCLLEGDAQIHVAGIVCTLEEAARQMGTLTPQVLLLDVAMPDGDGIDAIPALRTASPDTKIIVLSMFAEEAVVNRALAANAQGYVFKNVEVSELHKSIVSVMKGETYLCKEARELLSGQNETAPMLTMREREILKLIVEGQTMKEIANGLNLGFETVHSYTKTLRLKLGCNNTASLVRKALEQHLV